MSRRSHAAAWITGLLAAVFAVGLSSAIQVRWLLVNSDILLPAAFVHDLMTHGKAARWFQLPRIPSLVPDLAATVLLSAVIPSWRIASLAYAGLSMAAAVLAGSAIAARCAGRGFAGSAATFLALAVIAMLVDLRVDDAWGAYFYVLLPAIHSGSLLLGLGGLLMVRRFLCGPSAPLAAVICLTTAAGVLSDRIIVFGFVIPALCGAALFGYGAPGWWRRILPLAGLLAAGCAAGFAADHWLFARLLFRQPDVPIDLRQQLARLPALLAEPTLRFEAGCAAIVLAWPLLWRLRSAEDRFWWAAGGGAVLGTLALIPLIYVDYSATRYAQPVWWWALIAAAAGLLRVLPRAMPALLPLAAAALLLATVPSRPDLFAPAALTEWRDPVERCLTTLHEEGAIHAGIAQYWVARPIEASSNWALQVDQVTPRGWAFPWGNNRLYYAREPGRKSPPVLDFLVTRRLDMPSVAARFGPPARVVPCDGTEIWIYADPDRFRRYIVGIESWARRDGLLDHPTFFGPADLQSRDGPLPPGGTVPATGTDRAETAAWGPGVDLAPGSWTVRLSYSLQPASDEPALWNVRLQPGPDIAAAAGLKPGERMERAINFIVPPGAGRMELRTAIPAGARLVIHGFSLCPAAMSCTADGAVRSAAQDGGPME